MEDKPILPYGIKDTQEVFSALASLVVQIGIELQDGFQYTDLIHLAQQLSSEKVYLDAFLGLKNIVPELKDLEVSEIIALVMKLVMDFPKMIDAFKKAKLA